MCIRDRGWAGNRQWSACARCRSDEKALYPYRSWRQSPRGTFTLRFDQGSYRLSRTLNSCSCVQRDFCCASIGIWVPASCLPAQIFQSYSFLRAADWCVFRSNAHPAVRLTLIEAFNLIGKCKLDLCCDKQFLWFRVARQQLFSTYPPQKRLTWFQMKQSKTNLVDSGYRFCGIHSREFCFWELWLANLSKKPSTIKIQNN